MARKLRIAMGSVIWLAVFGGVGWYLAGDQQRVDSSVEVGREVFDFATGNRRRTPLQMADQAVVAAGDPIFVMVDERTARQVGEIAVASDLSDRVPQFEAVFYADAPPLSDQAYLSAHHTPESLEWVLRTMLPEEKRQMVMNEIAAAFRDHHEEIIEALRPVAEEALRSALDVVEQELPPALERHHDEIQRVADRYQQEIVEQEVVPLIREEVWPIVREHAEPTVNEIGSELWERVSLWRFGWRYLYDQSSLPRKELTKKEWQRFVDEEAVPVLEAHTDDFVEVQKRILADVARNPKVQQSVRKNLERVIADPEVRGIVWNVVREVFVENPRVREELARHWHSPEAQAALELAGQRLEPTAVRIGEILLGSPEAGITPEFARVLRNQILHKDRRWLVLHTARGEPVAAVEHAPATLNVVPGSPWSANPFVLATDASLVRSHGRR